MLVQLRITTESKEVHIYADGGGFLGHIVGRPGWPVTQRNYRQSGLGMNQARLNRCANSLVLWDIIVSSFRILRNCWNL